MIRQLNFVALFLAFMLLMPDRAHAQKHPQVREGFFISFGLGPGSLGCDNCGDDRKTGVSAHLKLGGTLNDQLLLGFESNAWVKEENGVTLTAALAAAIAQYYPNADSGLFVKGGIGVAVMELEVGIVSISENGLGLILGGGYDIRMGRNFSLSPFANFQLSNLDTLDYNVIQAGLGFTWH